MILQNVLYCWWMEHWPEFGMKWWKKLVIVFFFVINFKFFFFFCIILIFGSSTVASTRFHVQHWLGKCFAKRPDMQWTQRVAHSAADANRQLAATDSWFLVHTNRFAPAHCRNCLCRRLDSLACASTDRWHSRVGGGHCQCRRSNGQRETDERQRKCRCRLFHVETRLLLFTSTKH